MTDTRRGTLAVPGATDSSLRMSMGWCEFHSAKVIVAACIRKYPFQDLSRNPERSLIRSWVPRLAKRRPQRNKLGALLLGLYPFLNIVAYSSEHERKFVLREEKKIQKRRDGRGRGKAVDSTNLCADWNTNENPSCTRPNPEEVSQGDVAVGAKTTMSALCSAPFPHKSL